MQHLATLTTPPKPARFDHSGRLSERKRALFPSSQIQENSDDSDIGHMSPLEYSSSPEPLQKNPTFPDLEPLQDSDESSDLIIGRFSPDLIQINQENPQQTPDVVETIIPASPPEILKTPHDSNTNQKLPRLIRKSLIDVTNIDLTSLKRKSESPVESPANKTLKFDHHQPKTSKARTALFPESIFPAKSFYPKTELKSVHVYQNDLTQKHSKTSKKSTSVYLCNRSRNQQNNKKNFGLINAGVRHKIKKPRLKPALSKTQLLKAALNIVKNSPVHDVFFDNDNNECGVSYEQIQKMDSILKNLKEETHVTEVEDAVNTKKRCLSPQPEHPKKFFKSGHSNKATITISNKIKFKVEHGELSLIEKQKKKPPTRPTEINDFSFSEENSKIIDQSFTEILKTLDNDVANIPPSTTPPLNHQTTTLTAHTSIIKSENQIQLHNLPRFNNNNSMLLSPTSLVCDLTSGLALDSPKNQPLSGNNTTLDKLSSLKKRISFPENMEQNQQKLFPIFCGKLNNEVKPAAATKENKHVKNVRKIWKPLSDDQTLIDAGQKRFGVTQCSECKFVYSLGEPEDENLHYRHHHSIGILRYNCWKHERVVNHFTNGKIIQINPNDPKPWLKKVKDLLREVIDRELGFIDMPFEMLDKKVFLCIINKQIVGCLVSEQKTAAHKMLPNHNNIDQCTEQTFPIKCGVSRLWVAVNHRKKGIATSLMNAMRSNFMYGHILSTNEIAFSPPTEAGKNFASKYMKTDEFLIYTS